MPLSWYKELTIAEETDASHGILEDLLQGPASKWKTSKYKKATQLTEIRSEREHYSLLTKVPVIRTIQFMGSVLVIWIGYWFDFAKYKFCTVFCYQKDWSLHHKINWKIEWCGLVIGLPLKENYLSWVNSSLKDQRSD